MVEHLHPRTWSSSPNPAILIGPPRSHTHLQHMDLILIPGRLRPIMARFRPIMAPFRIPGRASCHSPLAPTGAAVLLRDLHTTPVVWDRFFGLQDRPSDGGKDSRTALLGQLARMSEEKETPARCCHHGPDPRPPSKDRTLSRHVVPPGAVGTPDATPIAGTAAPGQPTKRSCTHQPP